ncbi:MAG: ferrous iron transport protein B [Lachnospiraceae bacterium]|nr:ferrous iron transport protein B [Lachnospiraceae bacterium]
MTLKECKTGQTVRVLSVGGEGALRQHFLDMGVIPGAEMTVVKFAPMGDPVQYFVQGYELSLRLADAAKIAVEVCTEAEDTGAGTEDVSAGVHPKKASPYEEKTAHPGFGEERGAFHPEGNAIPLPEEESLTFALVGNPNSGKTTLFNQLTGAALRVGNFPGVTVERKDGTIRNHPHTTLTDLPGIYSMSPYSSEELVSRNFVLKEQPHAIINIVDVTSLERGLYLTMQLLEMDIPMVVALNMMDELTANHGTVDVNKMEQMLGTAVVPISASKNQGLEELVAHAIHIARYRELPLKQDFCDATDHGGAVHRCLHAILHLAEDRCEKEGMPGRFAASKLIEGDPMVTRLLFPEEEERHTLAHLVEQMEKERGLDRSAAIADMRYTYVRRVCDACVVREKESTEQLRSRRIDRLLTGRYTALPMFACIMAAIFYLTFGLIGPVLQDLTAAGIEALASLCGRAMDAGNVNENIRSLVMDGIFEGVGSVLSFLAVIVIMFFFLSLLEDTGYLARVAFFMDKLLRKIGLSGRSIVPMLIGFGCTVPAVMATRTLPSERDRRMTILLTPYMSCMAKLPIYAFIVSAFFKGTGWWLIAVLYLGGMAVAVLVALLFRKTLFRGEAVPFVMELPNYRMPHAKSVLRLLWEKVGDFLRRAFSVILIATIVVWFLQRYTFGFNVADSPHESMLAAVSGVLAPVMRPAGLGDWRIITSLFSGFMAKESVISVMEVLFPSSSGIASVLTPLTAAAMLTFSLLYTPCVAAIAAVRRELGGRWALMMVFWQCAVAWLCAVIVTQAGTLMGF